MNRTNHWASLAALGLLVGGCSNGSGDADREEAAKDVAGTAADETVFDDLLETQDRARAVEDLNDQRRELLESAIEPGEDPEASDEHSGR